MRLPIQSAYRLSTEFHQPRPLSASKDKRWHPHAAWDLACPTGTPICSPEDGTLYYFLAFRKEITQLLDVIDLSSSPFDMRDHHYFYDTYGGVILLLGDSGKTHVMAHSYANQLFNKGKDVQWQYVESAEDERWPVSVWHTFTDPHRVIEGESIGAVGNAGFSTGPHVHYEIHSGATWESYLSRVDPAEMFPIEWLKHKGDKRGYDWVEAKKRWG